MKACRRNNARTAHRCALKPLTVVRRYTSTEVGVGAAEPCPTVEVVPTEPVEAVDTAAPPSTEPPTACVGVVPGVAAEALCASVVATGDGDATSPLDAPRLYALTAFSEGY